MPPDEGLILTGLIHSYGDVFQISFIHHVDTGPPSIERSPFGLPWAVSPLAVRRVDELTSSGSGSKTGEAGRGHRGF
jgi:hypothetical protein